MGGHPVCRLEAVLTVNGTQKEHPPDPRIGGMHKVRLESIVQGRSHPKGTTSLRDAVVDREGLFCPTSAASYIVDVGDASVCGHPQEPAFALATALGDR